MTEDMNLFQQLDLENARHEHEMERAKAETDKAVALAAEQRRATVGEKRWETVQMIGIGLLIVSVLFGIGLWIYSGTTGDHRVKPDYEQQRERDCIADGGGYVPKDLLASQSKHGLCVFPGRTSQ